MSNVLGFNLLDPTVPPPWGPLEYANWESAVKTLCVGTVTGLKDITGHKHYILHGLDESPAITADGTGRIQLLGGAFVNNIDIDGTLSTNSDEHIPTQKAVKTYVDAAVLGEDFWDRAAGVIYPKTGTDSLKMPAMSSPGFVKNGGTGILSGGNSIVHGDLPNLGTLGKIPKFAVTGFSDGMLTEVASGINIPSTKYVGIGTDAGRLLFTDDSTDTLVFMDCNVGIGTNQTAGFVKNGTNGILSVGNGIASGDLPNLGTQNTLSKFGALGLSDSILAEGTSGINITSSKYVGIGTTQPRILFDTAISMLNCNVGIGTAIPANFVDAVLNQNAVTVMRVTNATDGDSAASQIQAVGYTGNNILIAAVAPSYGTAGNKYRNMGLLFSGNNSGLIVEQSGNLPINIYTDSTKRVSISGTGALDLYAYSEGIPYLRGTLLKTHATTQFHYDETLSKFTCGGGGLAIYPSSTVHKIDSNTDTIEFNSSIRVRINPNLNVAGNVGIGVETHNASSVRCLAITNGTPPAAATTGQISMWCQTGELWVMDSAGNSSQLSPHNEKDEWVFKCENKRTGKKIEIDAERFFKWFDKEHGTNFVREF